MVIFVFFILFFLYCLHFFYKEHPLFIEPENTYFCYGERYMCLKECTKYIIQGVQLWQCDGLSLSDLVLGDCEEQSRAKSKDSLPVMENSAPASGAGLCLFSTARGILFQSQLQLLSQVKALIVRQDGDEFLWCV